MQDYPYDYLYERARRFNCTDMGIYKALKRLGISRKKNKKIHPKQDIIKQIIYTEQLSTYQEQGYPIIYMDEAGFEQSIYRPYGYSAIGQPCSICYDYYQNKVKTNVIGALWGSELFATSYHKHNTNTQTVYDWLKYTLIPKLKQKCVIVMDNAPFHKSKKIQKLLNRHGHRLYSYHPIAHT